MTRLGLLRVAIPVLLGMALVAPMPLLVLALRRWSASSPFVALLQPTLAPAKARQNTHTHTQGSHAAMSGRHRAGEPGSQRHEDT